MSYATYSTINCVYGIVVNFNNGMSRQYSFIHVGIRTWRLCGEMDPKTPSELLVPVMPHAVGFNFTQKRAIFLLCKLVEQFPGAHPDGSMTWYQTTLRRLMITAPARESQMSRQQFKDSVFDVWNSQFSCSPVEAASIIDSLHAVLESCSHPLTIHY